MAYAGKRLYEMLATDLGDALYDATVQGANETTMIELVVADVCMSLALNDPRFDSDWFRRAVRARVEKRQDELVERDRLAQTEGY